MLEWDTLLIPQKDTLVQFVLYVHTRRHPPKFKPYQVPVYLGIYICGFLSPLTSVCESVIGLHPPNFQSYQVPVYLSNYICGFQNL
jgi:hypothetical protein